jgi:hypothetical protein
MTIMMMLFLVLYYLVTMQPRFLRKRERDSFLDTILKIEHKTQRTTRRKRIRRKIMRKDDTEKEEREILIVLHIFFICVQHVSRMMLLRATNVLYQL